MKFPQPHPKGKNMDENGRYECGHTEGDECSCRFVEFGPDDEYDPNYDPHPELADDYEPPPEKSWRDFNDSDWQIITGILCKPVEDDGVIIDWTQGDAWVSLTEEEFNQAMVYALPLFEAYDEFYRQERNERVMNEEVPTDEMDPQALHIYGDEDEEDEDEDEDDEPETPESNCRFSLLEALQIDPCGIISTNPEYEVPLSRLRGLDPEYFALRAIGHHYGEDASYFWEALSGNTALKPEWKSQLLQRWIKREKQRESQEWEFFRAGRF